MVIDIKDPIQFQIGVLNQIPHAKQCEVLRSKAKHKVICCGRRSGKSQMIGGEIFKGSLLGEYPRQIVVGPEYKHVRIVYEKIRDLSYEAKKVVPFSINFIKSPQPKIIINSSIIDFGSADNPTSLRGEAYDRIFLDEASFLKEDAMLAIKPMGFDTGAPIWMTSTPWGKGYFKEKYGWGLKGVKNYASFHYNYKDNPYLAKEGIEEIEQDIKEYGINSIYVQTEILGNFIEDVDAYFPQELVERRTQTYEMWDLSKNAKHPKNTYILGLDIARMGQDKSVFIVIEQNWQNGECKVIYVQETEHKRITDTSGRAMQLHEHFNFDKIYVDETGLGSGVMDNLLEHIGKGKVEGVTFTLKSKQDIYSNLKVMMDKDKLLLPNHKKLLFELMDLKYEMMSNGQVKIHHSDRGHDDYADALALACWHFHKKRNYPFRII